MRVLGVDLAWGQGRPGTPPNETGVVAVDPDGAVVDAGWTRGVPETARWIEHAATPDTIVLVDAPLVVPNATGMRECEKEVGRRYGRWKVSANASNLGLPGVLAGVALAARLRTRGWRCGSGHGGPPAGGRWLYESFPYLALVGAAELGYDEERPVYKRKPRHLTPAEFRVLRARNADEIVRRVAALRDPAIDLRAHPATAALLDEPTPIADRAAKHREDLLDAVLCAWTGLLWMRHGLARCQVLGDPPTHDGSPLGDAAEPATLIAPCRPEQRR